MWRPGCIWGAVLLLCPLALSRHDDDFAFENNEEFQVELTANHSEIEKVGLRRLWGVPDTSAYVGHLFRMEIPKEAFSGEVLAYKVRTEDGRRTPSWLAVDTKHGLISGVPQAQDLGAHTFAVVAHGRTHGLTAKDSFTIEVKRADEKPQSKYGACVRDQSRLVLVLLIDGPFHKIAPRQRIRALMELANFMALDGDEFWMEPYKAESNRDHSVIASGVGTTQRRRYEATTAIYLNVGCGERLWSRHKVLVAGLREQSRDGTLQHLLRLPVLGWRLVGVKPQPRKKRQSILDDGSGYDNYDQEEDEGDYSGYDLNDDDDDDYGTGKNDPVTDLEDAPPHPHRHHHGEPTHTTTNTFQTQPHRAAATIPPQPPLETPPSPTTPPNTPSDPPTTQPTPPTYPPTEETTAPLEETPEPTSTNTYTTEEHKVKITPYYSTATKPEASDVTYAREPPPIDARKLDHSPVNIVPDETVTSTEPEMQTVKLSPFNELPISSSETPTSPEPTQETVTTPMTTSSTTQSTTSSTTTTSTTPATTSTATTPTTPVVLTTQSTTPPTTQVIETTQQEITRQQETITSTERTSAITGQTTETVTFPMPANQPPTLNHHMKKLAITAGKAFRYIIPADLFTDPEDGSNLTFTMYEAENVPLSRNSWVQFIPAMREVYGLPLEAHVSRWNFIVEARDSEGLVARDTLYITVQQHKSGRTINHQFVMQLRVLKDYANAIDWQIRALEGIVNLFRDTDMHQITVLNATQAGDMYEFVWTNDTLPKDPACPMDDIKRLMKIMESDTEPNSPSAALVRAMSPELKAGGVGWRGAGRCAPPAPPAPDTYPPVTRNQVDHITATVGHLLVYKVPEDTFFDPEDGGTRNLALSLRYSDRSELPAAHWLQFDARNQEFYGLPAAGDEGSVHYQLIAEDSSKKSAYDSLIVEVAKAPTIRPTVEFQMTMDPSPNLIDNASNKRKVVEKLAALFGQKETDNIRIQSITDHPPTIIWYNTSLPMDRCPKREIEELRKMIIVDERNLKENVDQIFDKDLKVMSIRLIPLGLCADQNTKTPKTSAPVHSTNLSTKAGSANAEYSDYLVTFVIPAVVIVCMILVAGVIACVLYRRRRTGKMSVGDEEERQAFRSKGIPVIFQDELEERADTEPVDKSPVIMREEKPPLLPPAPDYRAGEDAPYRPPPPFAASRTPPRPKATPTYRKPPPYVPP